jgi:glycosyltransferase involved in cell wall biosynthesis
MKLQNHEYSVNRTPLMFYIFISIRHTARSSQNTGIQRVVRGFARHAVNDPRVRLVEWRNWKKSFYEPTAVVSRGIGFFGGPRVAPTPLVLPCPRSGDELKTWISHGGLRRRTPLASHPLYRGRKGWLVLPELMTAEMMRESIAYGKSMGLRVAVLLYDCIAYFHPEWANERIRENHRGYLHAMADADLVLAISETSALDYRKFLEDEKRDGAPVRAIYLAEEFLGIPQGVPGPEEFRGEGKKWKILYVSTLDPRKNHLRLLNAFERLGVEHPELEWELTLVGHRYEGAEEIAEMVQRTTESNPRVQWLQGVDDPTLAELYQSTDFTVFPSLVEGFGLPIAESLWRGKPCLCSGIGSMHEIAEKGGCLEIDPFSEESMVKGLVQMMSDAGLRQRLYLELKERRFKTWEMYAREILEHLREDF